MAYAVTQDLIDSFGEAELIDLTDRDDPPTGAVVEAVATREIAAAAAEVDGYCTGRYALPLAPVDLLVKSIVLDLARYRLYTRTPPDDVAERAKTARAQLRDINAGKLRLMAAAASVTAPGAGLVEMVTSERIFARDVRP